jgi:hypothetical protein
VVLRFCVLKSRLRGGWEIKENCMRDKILYTLLGFGFVCAMGFGCGGSTDDSDPTSDSEYDEGVLDVDGLLLSDGTTDATALTASGLFDFVKNGIGFTNDLLHEVFDRLKTATEGEPAVRKKGFRQWTGTTSDGIEWRFSLNRGKDDEKSRFRYGFQVKDPNHDHASTTDNANDAGDLKPDADGWRRVLWGAFKKEESKRGIGRIHFNFDRLKKVKTDSQWSGKVEFRFRNHGAKRVVNVGMKKLVTPENSTPINAVAQFAKGEDGKRHFRFSHRKNVVGDSASDKEWIAARAKWKIGVGGVLGALVAGGDVEENAAGKKRGGVRACWGTDQSSDAGWLWIDAKPDGFADLTDKGTRDDCVDAFDEDLEESTDDDSATEVTDSAYELGDFDVGTELPSEADSAEGESDDTAADS